MNRRTVALILAGGVALALGGRMLAKPNAPLTPTTSDGGAAPNMLPTGRATVMVFYDGAPLADRTAVFADEAGTVLATTKTDRAGSASGPMPARGMITVAHGVSLPHLFTITAVMPGETVVVGEREDEGGAGHASCHLAVSIPSAHPKATRYLASVGVNDTEIADATKPATLAVLKRFVVDGKVRALARAYDASGQLVAFAQSFVEGCAPSEGGAAAKIAVQLPAWSTDLRTFTIEATGGDRGTIEGTVSLVPPGSDAFSLGRQEAPLGPGTKLAFLAPRPLGTRARMKLEVKYDDGRDHAELDERRNGLAETTKLALGERLLPRIHDAVVDGAGSARPSVRWTSARSLASADAVVARFAWPESREHVWTILVPPDAPARLVVPALPDELAPLRPDTTKAISVAVGAVETSFWNGYADVKKQGLDAIEDPPDAAVVVIRSSATGPLDL